MEEIDITCVCVCVTLSKLHPIASDYVSENQFAFIKYAYCKSFFALLHCVRALVLSLYTYILTIYKNDII